MSKQKGKGRTSIWTDELVAQMLKLWEEGLSASEIARRLGHGLSRNAVIGKIHRLRAAGKVAGQRKSDPTPRKRATPKPGRRKEAAAIVSTPSTAAPRGGGVAVVERVEAVAQEVVEAQPQQRLRLVELEKGLVQDIMELKYDSCRWPIGNPGEDDFSYCGRKAGDGKPYCEHHAGLAYTSGNSGHPRR